MDQTSRSLSLSAKLTVAYSILILIISSALSFSLYWQLRSAQRQALQERAEDIARFASQRVDGFDHASIVLPEDEQTAFYDIVFERLIFIQSASPTTRHIYTLRQQEDNSIVYVVDNDTDPATHAPVGTKYQRPSALLEKGLANITEPTAEDDIYKDEAGILLSAYAPIYDQNQRLDGVLGVDIDATTVVESEAQARLTALAAFLATVPLSLLAGWWLSRRMTSPVIELVAGAERVAQGQLDQPVPVRSRDELGMLTSSFNSMQASLRQSRLQIEEHTHTLEQQVARRTQEAERRAAQIAIGAEIARVATTLLDPDQLIIQVVQLIRERFDFYYVGLFLVDADNRYAVLQYGTGEAGRIMKERGHRLAIGGQSMIGWACANRQARIALDVGKDAVRFDNPLTPETRSEMALPLRVGERVIGALTVQSTQPAAFDKDDIAALQGMADQIAVALENANQFQRTQQALIELDEANRLLARQGWQDYLQQAQDAVRYAEFCPMGARPATGTLPHSLHISLESRGQVIGTLVMERTDSNRPWTEIETETIRAIAQQAMLAVDNARLFEEAQRLAERERLINEITARIRSSMTVEGVLNAAVREISEVTGASFATIDLEVGK